MAVHQDMITYILLTKWLPTASLPSAVFSPAFCFLRRSPPFTLQAVFFTRLQFCPGLRCCLLTLPISKNMNTQHDIFLGKAQLAQTRARLSLARMWLWGKVCPSPPVSILVRPLLSWFYFMKLRVSLGQLKSIYIYYIYVYYIYMYVCMYIYIYTSSTAQGGGGSFKNRKPIGEFGCCESWMAERIHCWIERWLELCFLQWLQWLPWSPGQSPHPQLLDVVWCSAAVVVVVV